MVCRFSSCLRLQCFSRFRSILTFIEKNRAKKSLKKRFHSAHPDIVWLTVGRQKQGHKSYAYSHPFLTADRLKMDHYIIFSPALLIILAVVQLLMAVTGTVEINEQTWKWQGATLPWPDQLTTSRFVTALCWKTWQELPVHWLKHVEGRIDGSRKKDTNAGRRITTGVPKSLNDVTSTFFNVVNLLSKDLGFENGGGRQTCFLAPSNLVTPLSKSATNTCSHNVLFNFSSRSLFAVGLATFCWNDSVLRRGGNGGPSNPRKRVQWPTNNFWLYFLKRSQFFETVRLAFCKNRC